ncbi:hypothetical protein OESDEN_07570 [Oesophagostomum dentatum]|uniref:DUF4440 domain-containing protein n=1 Tax=Oesophagostomum dentatum TaxID=61180 RepID=A0A0B1T9R7_OESDE|nr:hypothetical protein OESDEN_07570 [Oesophagostomum dentatum]
MTKTPSLSSSEKRLIMEEKITEEIYQMAGDFIILTGKYEMTTEKMGELKGDFTQFWKKTGDTYKIIYDGYTF